MPLTPLDFIVLIAYFVVIAVIGLISARLVKNREDFLMGGRRFGKIMTAMFAFGSGTHADHAVGVAAQSYKVGLAGIWYQWVMLFTLPFYWLLVPVFRRARVLTTADFFERRFGPQIMLLYSAFALYITVSFGAVMLYGSGRLVESLTEGAISWQVAVLLMASISFFYAIAGGLIAAVWNDFFQGLLTIVMSLLILPFFWSTIGGAQGFRDRLDDPHRAFDLVLSEEMTVYWIIMMTLNSLIRMVVEPHIMSNTGAAKTEMDSRVGFVGGLVLKRIMTVPWALTGVMAIALFGAGAIEPDHAFGDMARALLPAGFVGLLLACVMASVMDNLAVDMLAFSGIYTNSIHRRLVRPGGSEAGLVRVTRIAGIAFALASIGLSFAFTDIPAAMRFLWQTVPLMGLAFMMGILWRRFNRYGAAASFVGASAGVLVGRYVFNWEGDAGLPNVISLFIVTGLVAGVVASLLTRPEPKDALDAFYLLMKTPIGREDILLKAGFVESSGKGTFDPPADLGRVEEALAEVENARFVRIRREAIGGAIVVALVALSLLAVVLVLASWLAGPQIAEYAGGR